MILSVYSIAIVAVFTGIIAGFYVELMKAKARDSARKFLDDLERLSEMSKEELEEISERARRFARERSAYDLNETEPSELSFEQSSFQLILEWQIIGSSRGLLF